MKISSDSFKNSDKKAITLMGMSGTGKSYIASKLEGWGWHNHSCDYLIGTEYLKEELAGASLAVDDISALSNFLGKLGSSKKNGFSLEKFRLRQKAYYDAECKSLEMAVQMLTQTDKNFVNDSTGSLCEIEELDFIKSVGENTLFVYLKSDLEHEKEILKRATQYPKPLFFPANFLTEKVDEFILEQNLNSIEDIDPDEFSRWVFPKLFEARKPKYQRLADLYGVTVPAKEFADLQSSEEFIDIVAKYLDE